MHLIVWISSGTTRNNSKNKSDKCETFYCITIFCLLELVENFEISTFWLATRRSASELYQHYFVVSHLRFELRIPCLRDRCFKPTKLMTRSIVQSSFHCISHLMSGVFRYLSDFLATRQIRLIEADSPLTTYLMTRRLCCL